MRKIWLVFLLLAFPSLVCASTRVFTPTELINETAIDRQLDGTRIVLEGEVISEAIERKDGCWVNVTDGSIAIGVFFKDKKNIEKIKYWGMHKVKGDTVRIEGKVHLADKETGGELDVQGEKLTVVIPGFRIDENIPVWKIIAGSVLGLIALLLIAERLHVFFVNRRIRHTNILEGFFDPHKEL
ncbi:MAG: hypothetical protein KA140_00915 [Caldisericia bacterium]|nr:hypothetical protein [Caldisericia bacterium]